VWFVCFCFFFFVVCVCVRCVCVYVPIPLPGDRRLRLPASHVITCFATRADTLVGDVLAVGTAHGDVSIFRTADIRCVHDVCVRACVRACVCVCVCVLVSVSPRVHCPTSS